MASFSPEHAKRCFAPSCRRGNAITLLYLAPALTHLAAPSLTLSLVPCMHAYESEICMSALARPLYIEPVRDWTPGPLAFRFCVSTWGMPHGIGWLTRAGLVKLPAGSHKPTNF